MQEKTPGVFGFFQIFTGTGMPGLSILFIADVLNYTSVFYRISVHAYIALPKIRLWHYIESFKKLQIVSEILAGDPLPGNTFFLSKRPASRGRT